MSQEIYLSDVQLAERYKVHRTTPWRWTRDGKNRFPKPVKLSEQITRWRLSEILTWEAEQAAKEGMK